MHILEISFEGASNHSGGGLGIKQSINTLLRLGRVDYVGPDIQENVVDVNKLNDRMILKYENCLWKRIFPLIRGISSGYYNSWKKYEKIIEWDKYDYVHIEFSRYPFLVKSAKRHGKKVLVRLHNVEADYLYNLYLNKPGILSYLRYIVYKNAEKQSAQRADDIICITEKDRNRLIELYGPELQQKTIVNPVCLTDRILIENDGEDDSYKNKKFLITGSLWYGPNAYGIIWFVQNVWSQFIKIHHDVRLVIAGANPSNDIKKIADQYKTIELVTNPDDMNPIIEAAYCYIAPVFDGAGMKVKVAEAMLHGRPILATRHALIGYTMVDGVYNVDEPEEFIEKMSWMLELGQNQYCALVSRIKDVYNKEYSYDTSERNYRLLINR